MIVNQYTQLFISVSSHPGSFGGALYNTAFQELGMNAIYRPLKCETISQFVDIVRYAKSYSISGISVSMPFKKIAASLSTVGDDEETMIGNVNTLVFKKDKPAPIGYNTDHSGFTDANWEFLHKAKSACIVGAGAMADSIHYVLESYNIKSRCMNSRPHKQTIVYDDWLINASPVGMDHVKDTFFTENFIKLCGFKFISDVVLKKETDLIKLARKLNIPCVNGVSVCLDQLCSQWEHYTATGAPYEVFKKAMKAQGYI